MTTLLGLLLFSFYLAQAYAVYVTIRANSNAHWIMVALWAAIGPVIVWYGVAERAITRWRWRS